MGRFSMRSCDAMRPSHMRLQRPCRSRLCSPQLSCSSNGTKRLSASRTSRRPGWAPTSMRYSANPCLLCVVSCHGAHYCLESGGDRVTHRIRGGRRAAPALCPGMLQPCATQCNSVRQRSAATGRPLVGSAHRLSAAPICAISLLCKTFGLDGTAEIHGSLTEHWPVRPMHARSLLETVRTSAALETTVAMPGSSIRPWLPCSRADGSQVLANASNSIAAELRTNVNR